MKGMDGDKMKIILYTENRAEMGKKLEKLIQNQLPEIQMDTINSVSHLSRNICRPLNRISVIVIFVTSEKDIARWVGIKSFFDNIRVILVLPDRTRNMVACGLQLHPSFISYSDSDFIDIISVLEKIYGRTKEVLEW